MPGSQMPTFINATVLMESLATELIIARLMDCTWTELTARDGMVNSSGGKATD